MILLLTGSPGTGKSTVAGLLAPHLPDGITIEVDHIASQYHTAGSKWDNIYMVSLGMALGMAQDYIRQGTKPVIICAALTPQATEIATGALHSPITTCVLLASFDAIQTRLTPYPYRDIARAREMAWEWAHKPGKGGHIFIDTTNKTPEQVAELVLSHIRQIGEA